MACKEIGFRIRQLLSFECDLYKVFFHLWGGGGPNWCSEMRSFFLEEDSTWTKVPRHHSSRRSFADVVRRQSSPAKIPLSGSNSVPLSPPRINRTSVFERIKRTSIFYCIS
jgi:hypothetical protein